MTHPPAKWQSIHIHTQPNSDSPTPILIKKSSTFLPSFLPSFLPCLLPWQTHQLPSFPQKSCHLQNLGKRHVQHTTTYSYYLPPDGEIHSCDSGIATWWSFESKFAWQKKRKEDWSSCEEAVMSLPHSCCGICQTAFWHTTFQIFNCNIIFIIRSIPSIVCCVPSD